MTSLSESTKPTAEETAARMAPSLQPPGDFEELRNRIADHYRKLPKSLARVARQVMDNPVEVALGSVASVATTANVAPSTLIRFAQLLGYDGFSALQEVVQQAARGRFASRIASTVGCVERDLNESREQVLYHVIAAGHQALQTMTEIVDLADIDTASHILSQANCVFILAGPGMLPLASFFNNYLSSLQIRSAFVEDGRNSALLDFAAIGDAVVAIDRSPIIEATSGARLLTKRGLPMIVLTDSEFSPLVELAAVSFKVIATTETGLLGITPGIALIEALVRSTHQDRQSVALLGTGEH